MSNAKKMPVWISTQAHDTLKAFCDRTGRSQVDVVSDLLHRVLKPQVEAAKATAKKK